MFSPVCVSPYNTQDNIAVQSLVTLAALELFLPSVCPHMFYKTTVLWKSLVTLAALIWFIPSMCIQMSCKIAVLWESPVTLAALIWYLPSMCLKRSMRELLCKKAWSHWLYWYGLSLLKSLVTSIALVSLLRGEIPLTNAWTDENIFPFFRVHQRNLMS